MNVIVTEKENELAGKDHQIKQARKFVEQEQRMRAKAEAERDSLQKQLGGIRDLLLADGGKTINNETLERIRLVLSKAVRLLVVDINWMKGGFNLKF